MSTSININLSPGPRMLRTAWKNLIPSKWMAECYLAALCLRSFSLPMCLRLHRPPKESLWNWVTVATGLLCRCHRNKRTFLKLSGMEISRQVIAFLEVQCGKGRTQPPQGFGTWINVSSSSLHLWPNPLSSTHPFFKRGLLSHFSMSSPILCPENLADSLRLIWNVTGNVI